MSLAVLIWIALFFAALPAVLFIWNLFLYTRPPEAPPGTNLQISILIPARNEERSIGDAVRAALACRHVDLELLVLDDHSEDRTAEIVHAFAAKDNRVRVITAPPLPAGWCGKQFACSLLAAAAKYDTLCFLDADVRLSPDGAARMALALETRKMALISGFPWQETVTPLEQLLIPLMHYLLLGFLPIFGMRRSTHPAYGAGCGQIFVANRAAYVRAGGHSAIRSSRHDGITLPKAFRRAGMMTDLCDASDVAACRMYQSAEEVINGLLKNATEGLASPERIIPFSLLLLAGQVLPILALAYTIVSGAPASLRMLALLATILSYLPRVVSAFRFRQPIKAAMVQPIAVLALLVLQWHALFRFLLRSPTNWKGRSYSATHANP